MIRSKTVFLPLAVLLCLSLQAAAEELEPSPRYPIISVVEEKDPLGIGGLEIVDPTGHSTLWHEMAGTLEDGETTTAATVSGGWTLELKAGTSAFNGAVAIGSVAEATAGDRAARSVNLNLFQVGQSVFGWGSMTAEGGASVTVTSSGTVAGNQLSLDLVSPQKGELYRLGLTLVEDAASGSYDAYNTQGATWMGSVSGVQTPT